MSYDTKMDKYNVESDGAWIKYAYLNYYIFCIKLLIESIVYRR